MLLTFLNLENKLKTYLTFQPSVILSPSIKTFTTLLVLIASFGFYLSSNAQIKKDGFSLPNSLISSIDTVANSAAQQVMGDVPGINVEQNEISQTYGLPAIDKEKISMLKENPGLLEQFGIDPAMIDSLEQNTENPDQAKPSNKSQTNPLIDALIKPYESFIAPFLAVSLFFTLTMITSIWAMFLSPVLWIIFALLTKTGFATFTTEMREVKKLVV